MSNMLPFQKSDRQTVTCVLPFWLYITISDTQDPERLITYLTFPL